ncbi:ABC transporter substrate-binding protein [Paenibacillus senegalensis]|uniref:ABC transporter substrate-binding protein n=1 Tax=Paenibacillus senegalensis TaxID=1465766 RepID=UPI000287F431|nr:sugar ABC transporter substrate-binding protein [Paenibacillus senegalensis]
MKLKWRLPLMMLVIMLSVVAAACSRSDNNGGSGDNGGKGEEAATLTIMAEVGSHTDAWKSVIPQFEEKYNVKVNVTELPWEQYRQQLNMQFTGGRGSVDFDLAYVPIGWVPEMQNPGYIAPISEGGNIDQLQLDDFPGIENAYFGENEDLYFVPYMNETHGILYRMDLFEDEQEQAAFEQRYGYPLAPPKTMEQYKQIAEFFHRPDEGLHGVTLMGDNSLLLGFHFYNRLFNYGGDIFDENYRPAFNNEAGIQALNDVKEMFEFTSAAAKQYSWGDASGEFLQGRSAMAEMATTIAQISQDPDQSTIAGKVGFSGIPTANEGDQDIKRFYLPFGFVMTSSSDAKEAAFQWIEFATSPEMMEQAAPVGNIPARVSVLEGPLSEQYPYYLPHSEIMQSAKLLPLPLIPEGATVTEDLLPSAISQFLNGNLSAEEALNQAAREVENLMESTGYYSN